MLALLDACSPICRHISQSQISENHKHYFSTLRNIQNNVLKISIKNIFLGDNFVFDFVGSLKNADIFQIFRCSKIVRDFWNVRDFFVFFIFDIFIFAEQQKKKTNEENCLHVFRISYVIYFIRYECLKTMHI